MADDDILYRRRGWDRAYINAIVETGFDHLCYFDRVWARRMAPGSVAARKFDSTGRLSCEVTPEGVQGAFWTFTPRVLECVGYFDTNAFGLSDVGHIDYTMRCCRAGFSDIAGPWDISASHRYLRLMMRNYEGASTRKRYAWNPWPVLERKMRVLRDEARRHVPYNERPLDMNFKRIDSAGLR
jgi:hypothetical protein